MKKHIEKLKQRSPKDRKKMATIFAAIVTGIIVILWIVISSLFKNDNPKKLYNTDSLEKAFEGIGGQFLDIENQFKEQGENIENIKEKIETSVEQEAFLTEEIAEDKTEI